MKSKSNNAVTINHDESIAMTNEITAVWVYWAGGADGDELRYSMRSVVRHFRDLANVVICGDVPDWYTGDAIPSPRWNKADAIAQFGSGRFSKWSDSVLKLTRILDSELVTDRFLWLYDDTFFVRDITAAELSVPRVTRQLCANTGAPAPNTWREVLRRTAIALHEAGRPSLNYSHHGPVVYEKNKLRETIAAFDPFSHPRAIESLYCNHHYDAEHAQPIGGWLQYNKTPANPFRIHDDAAVVNVGGFAPQVERTISAMFPDPAPHERPPAPKASTPPPDATPDTVADVCPADILPPPFNDSRRRAA